MSDKLINPFTYPSVAALNLTVELIRVGKMSSPFRGGQFSYYNSQYIERRKTSRYGED
ncbi:hypothetical protein CUX00_004730 [Escherichia coli]|uniref:hypothetical protein n=1 Tax=Escherichia TaxID=561 RepID=UPI0012FF22E8|nr:MULTISPECIES: hypothetical protein [Escherichia]EKH5946475.1 hypothetical protein [Escherichia coli O103]EEQ3496069.1 hypothetical protein [Escherichia coli]EEY3226047.1 hypothetical protein [Escherichia coli]EFI7659144.1 hypothetical protein [Escherichia coli]EFK7467704.1 hypothetical protein [Escherichia coli]